jgi:DNA modification methylase
VTVQILIGDVREQLRRLPSNFFDCVVTSPPYWGLRDYGVVGQIGLERTLGEHLAVMVDVFREVRRVLKPHGTCWLNYGDCYAATPNGRPAAEVENDDRSFRDKPFSTVGPICGNARGNHADDPKRRGQLTGGRVVAGGYLKPKDLCMIPNRLAIALQDDGWWVRSEIIWHKKNPMPESVYDRPTQSHEKIWLLTKSEDYFFNDLALREPVTGGAHARAAAAGRDTGVGFDGRKRVKRTGPNSRINVDRVPVPRKRPGVSPKTAPESERIVKANARFHASTTRLVETRHGRNVWSVASKAFKGAHFATFPPEIARRCVKAGTPAYTCAMCGALEDCGGLCKLTGVKPGHVLDPFGGSGTVGLIARELGLDCTLIELNPEYAELAERRIFGERELPPVLLEAAE